MRPLRAGDPPKIGGYQVLGRLGSGAMGEVFYAQSHSARPIAIKVIRRELADSPEFRQRFAREVAAMQQVGGFWTVAVLDADADADQPWLASEYIPGPNLHEAVAQATFQPPECFALMAGLAEALCAIHRAGLIHRDLKPSNVILGPHGPKVLDFGIARLLTGDVQTLTKAAIGTPAYMAPEQIRGDDIGPACDVWALGATVAFAATRHSPFEGSSVEAVIHNVLSRPPNLGDMPSELADLLAACLNKQPDLRPSAQQLLSRTPAPPAAPASAHSTVWSPQRESAPPGSIPATRTVPEPSAHGPTYAYQPVPSTRLEPLRRTPVFDSTTPGPPPSAAPTGIEPEQRRPPWRSVPALLTTIMILQVVLGLAVVVRDVVSANLVSNGRMRTEFEFMNAVYLNQFHTTDAVLFALAFATTTLTATALIRTVYASKGWRTWTLTAAIIVLTGYTINAVDLPTRWVTHIVFPGDSDNDPKLTLDHATAWYTVIASNVTLLTLVCAILVIAALRQQRQTP